MSTHGKRDQKSDAPKFSVNDKTETGTEQFGNTVFGADATETSVTAGIAHSGWVRITEGSGGRSGRIQYETLVAGGIDGDATDFANTSTDNVANTTGTADNTKLPNS